MLYSICTGFLCQRKMFLPLFHKCRVSSGLTAPLGAASIKSFTIWEVPSDMSCNARADGRWRSASGCLGPGPWYAGPLDQVIHERA
jgi:hypothetical protein